MVYIWQRNRKSAVCSSSSWMFRMTICLEKYSQIFSSSTSALRTTWTVFISVHKQYLEEFWNGNWNIVTCAKSENYVLLSSSSVTSWPLAHLFSGCSVIVLNTIFLQLENSHFFLFTLILWAWTRTAQKLTCLNSLHGSICPPLKSGCYWTH